MSAEWMAQGAIGEVVGMLVLVPVVALFSAVLGAITFHVAQTLAKALQPI
jgi:hypothetical protein